MQAGNARGTTAWWIALATACVSACARRNAHCKKPEACTKIAAAFRRGLDCVRPRLTSRASLVRPFRLAKFHHAGQLGGPSSANATSGDRFNGKYGADLAGHAADVGNQGRRLVGATCALKALEQEILGSTLPYGRKPRHGSRTRFARQPPWPT